MSVIPALPSDAAAISPTNEARQRIENAAALYDNEDGLAERYALTAYLNGRASYWTTATYHAQRHAAFHLAVHRTGSIRAALKSELRSTDDFIRALDTLVPLNEQAAVELACVYADFGCWFLELAELTARRDRRMPATRVSA